MEFTNIMDSPIKVVLVLIAMEAEAKPFIEALGLIEVSTMGQVPCRAFKGTVGHLTVVCVRNGNDIRHSVDNVSTKLCQCISKYMFIFLIPS